MKRVSMYLFIGWCAWWSCASSANTVYERYLQAHNAYAQEQYAEAITLLESIPAHSFPMLYNLGWAYYKQGDFYNALKNFFKASRSIASGRDRARAYAMYATMQEQLGLAAPASSWWQSAHRTRHYLQRQSWYVTTIVIQLISLCFLFLLLMALLCRWRRSLVISLASWVLLSIAGSFVRYQEKTTTFAFAKQRDVALRTGPDEEYGVLATVPQGTLMSIVSAHDLWYCVALGAQKGWVSVRDLDLV